MLNRFISKIICLLFLSVFVVNYRVWSEEESSWQDQERDQGVVWSNSCARVLDRDGGIDLVWDISDSFNTPSVVLASTSTGGSPLYAINKQEILSIELDGFFTNMSGWEYARATVKMSDNRQRKGFVKIFHMGLHGYRTFSGTCNTGDYMISWKRLKKIEFQGQWTSKETQQKVPKETEKEIEP